MKQHNKLMAVLSLLVLLPPANLSAIQSAQPQRKSPGAMKQNDNLNSLPAYVEEIMRRLPVTPGLAVAVVRGDRVIFARGFGYRDLKAKLPVTPQTAFYIASTTKSFTGTALKLLADEGKIDLDAPVKTYLPGLTLKAPLSTEQISLRDLLTHRSGISNEPINFRSAYTGQHNAETISNLLANYTTPVPPAFRYSNIGYIVAAYAAERATGEKWQQLIERKLIAPLGLNHTTCYASKARAGANFALPYLAEKDDFTELPYKEDATMHAAGGMVSSAEDLAKWLVVNMNGGRYEGKQIIPARSLEEILSPQVDQKRTFYKFERYAYGLGWNIGTYKGDKFVHCFGDFPGFRPHVSFMPEHDLGVVVLANESRDAIFLPDLIACDIYDYLLRRQPLQVKANAGVEEYAANLKKDRDERSKRAAAENERGKGAPPTLELAAYAGAYENPEFGKIVVAVENNRLVARFGVLTSTLVHSKGDS
ncbi:MAG TPA: serine hydrolase, partial [Pyrinomonadaceae bacterium]|nr:serine hydrolase [Pyrinomonadaceae bacterium]